MTRILLILALCAAAAMAQTPSPYSFTEEIYVGGNFTRSYAGPSLPAANFGGWNVSGTRYFNPILGLAVDAQGIYGRAPLENSDPLVRKHYFLAGPQIRWRRGARLSASIRLMAGVVNTSTESLPDGITPTGLGMYQDATKLAFRPGTTLDFNLSPRMALRLSNGPLIERQNGTFKGQLSTSIGLVLRLRQRPTN